MHQYMNTMKAPTKEIVKYYQYNDQNNIGDIISEVILTHFLPDKELKLVHENTKGKLCAVGSIMSKVRENDILWGVGTIKNEDNYDFNNIKVLALRGKLTGMSIGRKAPVYGDPALLLPLIYHPEVKKTKKIGYIPHYVDKEQFKGKEFIDVALPWKEFVDKILECEEIVSSSLHGIVIAEAYGIPATWEVYSNKVIGNGFKFQDYLTGTGRSIQGKGRFPPIRNLKEIQDKLVGALQEYYREENR